MALQLIGVFRRSRRGYYVMDSGRRVRFYPWPGTAAGSPVARQRALDELNQDREMILDESYGSWDDLQVRVGSLLGLNI